METALMPSSRPSAKFTKEQIEFILRKIASFHQLREIMHKFTAEYPDSGLTRQQLYGKIRYIAKDKRAAKWRKKVDKYREELRQQPLSDFAIANSFDRIRILQKLIDIAREPNLRRILWYPERKDRDGTLHYGREEIWEPNYHAALRAITLVCRELRCESQNSCDISQKTEE